MTPAAPTTNERERLVALQNHEILDTPAEAEFDDLTFLAAQICGTPIALISFVDGERQWFKSNVGLELNETARDVSFCAHAIHGRHLMEVPDAREDFVFYDNPLVAGGPEIRFYAGLPLATSDGQNLGTLCVMDRVPRQLSPAQRDALDRLGRQAMNRIAMRLTTRNLASAGAELCDAEERSRLVMEAAPHAILMVNDQGLITLVNARAEKLFGYSRHELIGQPAEMLLADRFRTSDPANGSGFFNAWTSRRKRASRGLRGRRKDGRELPIEVGLNPLSTSAGRFTMASITNATAQKRAENRIKSLRRDSTKQAQQLEQANRELANLGSAVSSEIMAPLRGIGSLANRLVTASANKLDGSGRAQLNLLALRLRRLTGLLNGILNDSTKSGGRDGQESMSLALRTIAPNDSAPSKGRRGLGVREHLSSPQDEAALPEWAGRVYDPLSDSKSDAARAGVLAEI
ncbi:MAG: PAS domain S-box protein [Spartobacteria bacterium]